MPRGVDGSEQDGEEGASAAAKARTKGVPRQEWRSAGARHTRAMLHAMITPILRCARTLRRHTMVSILLIYHERCRCHYAYYFVYCRLIFLPLRRFFFFFFTRFFDAAADVVFSRRCQRCRCHSAIWLRRFSLRLHTMLSCH